MSSSLVPHTPHLRLSTSLWMPLTLLSMRPVWVVAPQTRAQIPAIYVPEGGSPDRRRQPQPVVPTCDVLTLEVPLRTLGNGAEDVLTRARFPQAVKMFVLILDPAVGNADVPGLPRHVPLSE